MSFCVALSVATLCVVHAQTTPPPTVNTSTKAIVAAASAYVESYSTKMQNVLADELATQHAMRDVALPDWMRITQRTTKADLFITFLPAESIWIAARDVREVDGAVVDDPDNIRMLMERAPLSRLGAVIARKNAQFNIGNISRTFNEPTLALLIMTSKHRDRFTFDRDRASSCAATRVTLSFKEKDRPTLIASSKGAPVYTFGTMLVDATTGRIEATRLELKMGTVKAKIETTYAENLKLQVWVPISMRETYEQTSKGFEERINCESTYTNYRRFETSAIIK